MAEIIMRMEYIVGGSIAIALASVLLYIALSRLLSGIFVKHWFIFIDTEGKVKEIVAKSIRKGKTAVKHRDAEYQIDPTHKYHVLAYDEKNELRIRKDGSLDSMIRAKTVEEYELAAFSMLSRLLQSKLRAVDMLMLMMLGIVLIAVIFGFMQGHK